MVEEKEPEIVMVKAYHTQALRYCKKGAKKYMVDHGFNWDVFVKTGYPADEILAATGNDTLAVRAVEFARKEIENGEQ